MWFWEVEEGKHTIPVSIKGLDCLRERVLISCDELPAELPGIPKGVGVGDLNEQRPSLGLLAFMDLVDYVEDFVVPAPLLPGVWPDLIDCGPDAHIAVGDDEDRGAQATIAQVSEDLQPGLGGLSVSGHQGENLFAAIAHCADDDQQARLILLQAGFDIDAVGPGVDQLAIIQASFLPGLVVGFPLAAAVRATFERCGKREKATLNFP